MIDSIPVARTEERPQIVHHDGFENCGARAQTEQRENCVDEAMRGNDDEPTAGTY